MLTASQFAALHRVVFARGAVAHYRSKDRLCTDEGLAARRRLKRLERELFRDHRLPTETDVDQTVIRLVAAASGRVAELLQGGFDR